MHLLGATNALAARSAGTKSASSGGTKRATFSNAQQLNQLALTDEEEKTVQGIFDAMREKEAGLADIDVSGVEEMVHVMQMENVLREDERKQLFTRESLLEGAPKRNENSWQVPRLVK